jgi:SPX domain protein involved in polyphosphate accumulation
VGDTKLVFKRYEKKYLLSREQYETLFRELRDHIVPDAYHRSTVCSIYYDTDDYELIRRSIEAPVYKEKLRLRSYGVPDDDGTVFIELKKKYKGMVYKRRVPMGAKAAMAYLAGEADALPATKTEEERLLAKAAERLVGGMVPAPAAADAGKVLTAGEDGSFAWNTNET